MTSALGLPHLALAIGVLIGIAGQMLLKGGAETAGFVEQLFHPKTILGLGCYGISAMLYMIALRKIPVSVAFPSVAMSYAMVAVLGFWLYGESLGPTKIIAIAMICGGVLLLYRT